jgi:hypothetical protein
VCLELRGGSKSDRGSVMDFDDLVKELAPPPNRLGMANGEDANISTKAQ